MAHGSGAAAGAARLLIVFAFVPPPATPLMLIRLVQGYGIAKDWTRLEDIAPSLPRSVIAAEDNLFCQHSGFDWRALRGELDAALEGERPRGASTMTMQTAKNLFLWPGRDPLRKIVEAWLTPQIELLWTKRRIMEVYLNIVELGPGIYGAEAAARHWFKKPAAKLTTGRGGSAGGDPAVAACAGEPVPRPYVAPTCRHHRRPRGPAGSLLDCVVD